MFPVKAHTRGSRSAFLAGLDCDCPNCDCGCSGCGDGLGYSVAMYNRDMLHQRAAFAKPIDPKTILNQAWSANTGESLKKAVDSDPGVRGAIASVSAAIGQYNNTLAQAKEKCPRRYACQNVRTSRPPGVSCGGWDAFEPSCLSRVEAAAGRLQSLEAGIDMAKAELVRMRESAMDRITQAIPYKGHVIKPKLEGNDVWYHVTFNISSKQGKYRSPQEAKAAIDNEIALGPGGLAKKEEFEDLAKKVGEAKAAEVIKTKEAADKAAVAMAAQMPEAPDKQPWSTKKKLLLGGAAAAAIIGTIMVTK